MNIYFSSSDTRNCHISSVTKMYKQSKIIHYQDIPACYKFLVLLFLLHRLRHLPLPPFLFLFVFYYLSHMYLNNHLFATGSIHSQWVQLNLQYTNINIYNNKSLRLEWLIIECNILWYIILYRLYHTCCRYRRIIRWSWCCGLMKYRSSRDFPSRISGIVEITT